MAQAKWHKTNAAMRPTYGPGNTLIDVWDISYEVDDTGDTGMVSIPANQFTAERAAQEIQAKADELLKLHQYGRE